MDKYLTRKVVLVDSEDIQIGIESLIKAHQNGGVKHRALSLVLYRKNDGKIEVLLQQRATTKLVFPKYWANTCCYNLAPGEDYIERAKSRVNEELGINLGDGPLRSLYRFSYEANDHDNWCENELDTVLVGQWDGKVTPNPNEVRETKWIEWQTLKNDIVQNPAIYAPWWKLIVFDGRVEEYLTKIE